MSNVICSGYVGPVWLVEVGHEDLDNDIFLFLVMGLAVPYLKGQPYPPLDIYSMALMEGSKAMDDQWSGFDPDPRQMRVDYMHMLVYKDMSVPGTYPEVAVRRRYEYLSGHQLRSRRRAVHKDFAVLVVQPARVDGSPIKVAVALDWVSVVKGHLGLSVSDWADVAARAVPLRTLDGVRTFTRSA